MSDPGNQSCLRSAAAWLPSPAVGVSFGLHIACLLAFIAAPGCWVWVLALLAADHILLAAFGLWPRSPLFGPNLVRLPAAGTSRGEVALTFDDGPDPAVTPYVLDLLDRHGATASFFCIGRRVAAHPDLVRDIVRRGHSVENHSLRHSYCFAFGGPLRLLREVRQTQRVIGEIATAPRFFRAPMGLRSPLLHPILTRGGLRYVSWTRRGCDGVSGDARAVLRRLTRELAAGDILMLHDGSCAKTGAGEPVVLAVLSALLDLLNRRGLRGVSLPMALISETGRFTVPA